MRVAIEKEQFTPQILFTIRRVGAGATVGDFLCELKSVVETHFYKDNVWSGYKVIEFSCLGYSHIRLTFSSLEAAFVSYDLFIASPIHEKFHIDPYFIPKPPSNESNILTNSINSLPLPPPPPPSSSASSSLATLSSSSQQQQQQQQVSQASSSASSATSWKKISPEQQNDFESEQYDKKYPPMEKKLDKWDLVFSQSNSRSNRPIITQNPVVRAPVAPPPPQLSAAEKKAQKKAKKYEKLKNSKKTQVKRENAFSILNSDESDSDNNNESDEDN